jgi:osmotically-inducible protein OsmY
MIRKLLTLAVLGVGALVAYNYGAGRDLFQLPGTPAEALGDTVRATVSGAVRETVRGTARATTAEVKERAKAGVKTAASRAEEAVEAAALTSKIKAKMALDDLVKASDINVDTDGSVITLTGDVGSADERRRALRIATETEGVTQVVSHLRVR